MFVNGFKLVCPHCKGETFDHQETLLNTSGMTFLKLDWLNRNADTFFCHTCSRIEWFIDAQVSEEANTEGKDCSRCGTYIAAPGLVCPNCKR